MKQTNEMTLKEGIKKLLQMIFTEKKLFFGATIFMILTTAGRLLDPLIIAHIIDVSVPNEDVKGLFRLGGFYVFVIISSGFLSYLQIIWMSKLGLKIINDLKLKIFNHLLYLPVAWFDKTPVGELISRVESDSERIKQLFSSFSVTIIGNILFFFGVFIILLYKNWTITLLLLIPLSLVSANAILLIRFLTKFYKKSRELNADITGRLTEYIQGINIVQIFNQQQKAEEYINEKSKAKQKNDTLTGFLDWGVWGFNDFLMQTVFVIMIILYLSPKIMDPTNEVMTIGVLVIFIQYSLRLLWPIISISENLNEFQRAFVSLRRVFGLLNEKTECQSEIDATIICQSEIDATENVGNELMYSEMNIDNTINFDYEIEFRNVWFKYKEDEWVLKDISFTIKKGSKLALVGASGSGKTTCVSLLCRFYTIDKGQILIDGQDIYSFGIKEWRKKIGLILQDIILFPGNLMENIRIYDRDISPEKVLEAIKLSHSEQLLTRMDNDLTSEIKERGQNLSIGERQLIAFSRALCFNPEIIIMDEATASIDAQTEALIQDSISQVLKNKTAIIVAHRLISVLDCDEILLFENGEIIARGTHETLLIASPEYKKLVELQFVKRVHD